MNKDTTELIRNKLNADAEGICRKLLGNGKKVGNKWIVGDVHNAAGDSMKVDLSKCLWYNKHPAVHEQEAQGVLQESTMPS